MSDDYLWDRSGKPDPEVERLERTLGGHRYGAPPPPLPAKGRFGWGLRLALAGAAAALLAVAGWLLVREPAPAWEVAHLEGRPRCGQREACRDRRLRVGEWLVTDASSRARLKVADIGLLDVAPRTRIRLKATGATEHRLDLARGGIRAQVTAPPRLLVVETPSAVAVDLGCVYTLEVDSKGNALLAVETGWVALELPARSAIVPAGARCETRAGIGPGTPYFADAPPALREALARFDFARGGATSVEEALSSARRRDTLSLYHLLSRVEPALRGRVYERMVSLASGVAGCGQQEAVLALQPGAMNECRQGLAGTW